MSSHDHPHDADATREGGCDEALHELYHLLAGELTDDVRSRISLHLEDCSPCAEPYDFYAELRRVVAQRCRDQAPPALLSRIEQALNQEA